MRRARRTGATTASPLLGAKGFLVDEPATAALFDGTTQYVGIADATGLHFGDTFSVVAWFRRSAAGLSGNRSLVYGGPNSFDIQVASDDRIRVTKAGVSQIAKSTVAVTDTMTWHMLVITKAGASFHIWLDGVDVTDSVSNATISDTSNLRLGSANNQYLPARMAEVAVFPAALSGANIAELWAARAASDYRYGLDSGHPVTSLELRSELPRRNWGAYRAPVATRMGSHRQRRTPAGLNSSSCETPTQRPTRRSSFRRRTRSAAELVQEVAGELVVPSTRAMSSSTWLR